MRASFLLINGALASLLFIGCGPFGDEGGGGGKSIPASLTFMSSSIPNAKRNLAKSAMMDGKAISHQIAVDSNSMNPPPNGVDTSHYLSYRITPDNMEGRLIQAALMVGQPGAGGGGSAVYLVTHGGEGYSKRSVPNSSELPLFNLSQRLTMGDGFQCCWETYPSADKAFSGWFEMMFAYVDILFTLPEGALQGSHSVRIAYAKVDDLGYQRGDMLYRTESGWHWIDSATGEFAQTRPTHPLQMASVAVMNGNGDKRGNAFIQSFFVAIQDSQKVHMPSDTVLANSWEFIVDFILRQGIIVRRVDPAKATSVLQLLSAFDVRADRDNTNGNSDGVSCNFYAIKTPLDQPRPNSYKDSLDQWIHAPPAEDSI